MGVCGSLRSNRPICSQEAPPGRCRLCGSRLRRPRPRRPAPRSRCGSRAGRLRRATPVEVTLGQPGESRRCELSVAVTGTAGVSLPVTVICETGRGAGDLGRDRHGGRAGLDDVDGVALPLRPGLVEHPGAVHRGAAGAAGRGRGATGRADRVRAGPAAPGEGAAGPRLQVRAGRGRLPEAALRRVPAGPGVPAVAARRRAGGARGRHLQRAQQQPDRRGDDDQERGVRDGVPARGARRRRRVRVDARRVRLRPGIPRADGGGRADLLVVGARPVPPVGSGREHADAVPGRVRVALPRRVRAADRLHGQPLRRRVDAAHGGRPGSRPGRGAHPVQLARHGGGDAERDAAGGVRPRDPGAVGDRRGPRVGEALRVAALRPGGAAGVLRGGPRLVGGVADAVLDHAADPGHEPAVHRQGRFLRRHQAGRAGGRDRGARGRAAGDPGLAGGGGLPGRIARQGVAAARLRRAPRRDHRHRVRPGVPGPAGRMAGGVAAGRRRPAGRDRVPHRGRRRGRGRDGPGRSGRRRAGGDGGQRAGPAAGRDGDGHRPAGRAGNPLAHRPRRGLRRPPPRAGRRVAVARGRVAGRVDADVPRDRRAAPRVPAVPATGNADARRDGGRRPGARATAAAAASSARRNRPGSATGSTRTGSRSPTTRSR